MEQLTQHISEALSNHFNQHVEIKHHSQVFGGDINQNFQLQTNIGRFFLKVNHHRYADMFAKEFAGLKLLYDTHSIRVPQPIFHGRFREHIFLLQEFIEKGNARQNFWETFANKLAALHRNSNDRFGSEDDNYIGSLEQRNTFCDTWPEFYRTQRIMPLMQRAFDAKKVSKQELARAEKLCDRFEHFFPPETPSLIDGDLWSGNYLSDESGDPVIFDPAVYYGNREMDIAMSMLFGGFEQSFFDHYNDAFPLESNWRERIHLCQLYPLLVHLILFGGHYYSSVMNVITAYA